MALLERLGVSLGAAIYVASVVTIGGLLIVRTAIWLRSAEKRRRERVEEKQWFEAVLTDTPLDDPVGEARARGLVNIEGNTTVTRRVLVPTLVVGTIVLAALPFLGQIPAALISVVAAIVTVVVGVAARPVVENAFAGLAIAWSRQVNIGDTVLVDDFYGTVEDITVTHTTVRLWDWRRYVVPNAKMMNSSLVNYSLHDRFQWAHVEFWVGPEVDLDVVEELAVTAPESSAYFAAEHEPPRFWVMELGQHGNRCWIAAWANTPSEAWSLKCDIRTALSAAFRREGISVHGFRLDAQLVSA